MKNEQIFNQLNETEKEVCSLLLSKGKGVMCRNKTEAQKIYPNLLNNDLIYINKTGSMSLRTTDAGEIFMKQYFTQLQELSAIFTSQTTIDMKKKYFSALHSTASGQTIAEKTKSLKVKSQVYFDTMSEAIDEAYRAVREKGFEPVELAFMWNRVNYGETRDTHIDLTKDGKETKKCLHVQLYRMPSGSYELNHYIN